jgi:serine/threonine protein kinase/dienelactone hydrolase
MNQERRLRIEALAQEARDQLPQQRAAFLSQACEDDAELGREVEALLANESQAGSTLTALAEPTKTRMGPGSQIGPYKIEAVLGEGGMGTVFRARDTRLGRTVAIKLIRAEFAQRGDFQHRFEREARTISALNHPHICALYDIGQQDGAYLVMEFVEGETLSAVLKKGPLSLDQALRYGAEVADALTEAHGRGIVHRDLKPANIMITAAGVKVLDFGLAKRAERIAEDDPTNSISSQGTRAGQVLGTVAYMSPEQAEGKNVDAQSDIFSLGVVLYEMLCGRRPFRGDTTLSTLAAILRETPETPRKVKPEIPESVERLVLRCLQKKPDARPAAADVQRELAAYRAKPSAHALRRPALAAAVLLIVVAGALGGYGYLRASRTNWVEKQALPQINDLLKKRRPVAALRLLRQAEQSAPSAPGLVQLRAQLFGSPVSLQTNPAGAKIYARDYTDEDDADLSHWEYLGQSPIKTDQLPPGLYRLKVVQEGSEEVERATTLNAGSSLQLRLVAKGESPAGMVRVAATSREAGGFAAFPVISPVQLPEFWLDKYEVTNRQFKEFVDRGGYEKQEYWKHPFIKDGKSLSWEKAMAEFRDATGRPGPSTWELGTYPEGKADLPVGGVSWYEAAAYAEFAGKSLPTAYHWYRAAGVGGFSEIMSFSNFAGQGPARGGSYRSLGPFGTYDMAGNVKEWTSSPAGDRFYLLGGGWNEPSYMFSLQDARKPFDRAATFGFRCAKYPAPLVPELTGPVPFVSRDRRTEKAADDQVFQIYRSLHSYDKTDLKAAVESSDDSSPYWRRENVTFSAAYGNERVIAHLYLPKNTTPPFQVVTLFPGANALVARTPEELGAGSGTVEFIVRSGRAVILPAYKGTLERGPSEYYHQIGQPARWTEMNLQWSKDLGRTIDYLETRPDIDVHKLAYYGVSLGAAMGPRLIAVEPRFQAALLFSAGTFEKVPPEVDPWNFAPRVKIPLLMLNGRDDFRFPLETSQVPLFRAIGTPEKDKRLVLFDGGHDTVTRLDAVREALDWLDRYLGPVKTQ